MKQILTLAALLLIIICQNACRTIKNNNRQQSRSSERGLIDSRIREQESINVSSSTFITDSSGQFYQATIFPSDTFQFSLRDGFKGKALKVEVRGSVKQLIRVNEVGSGMLTRDSSEVFKSRSKIGNEQVSAARSIKRWSLLMFLIFFAAGLVLIGLWVKKLRRNNV